MKRVLLKVFVKENETYKLHNEDKIFTSTRSKNNYIYTLSKKGCNVVEAMTLDIYLNKENLEKSLSDFLDYELFMDSKDTKNNIKKHIMQALENACVFKKYNL